MMGNHKIILFDGVCNLCNGAIQFVLKHDRKDVFRYAPLQGEIGKRLLAERHMDPKEVGSIVLMEPGVAYYTKSAAALKIGQEFGGPWKMLGLFEWVPEKISNFIYDIVARNRYRWFGKKEECMVPTPALREKFL